MFGFLYPLLFSCCLLGGSVIVTAQTGTIDSIKLQELLAFCETTLADEVLLLHRGETIAHWQNTNCDSLYFNTASMVKSWTGLVIGTLVDRQLISSVEDPVCRYLPEWEAGCTYQVSIKDLLTMSAGLNRRGARGILSKNNMNDYVRNIRLDTLPRIRFAYSNESVQLLGILIEKVSGMRAGDYFQEVLFNPLHMDSTSLMRDAGGNDVVFGGARTTVHDAAKIGQLMLDQGEYQDRQIVSAQWIADTVRPSAKASYYGYLWWLDTQSKYPNYAAMGDYGQLTVVFPHLELVLVRRQTCDKPTGKNMNWMGPQFLQMIAAVVSSS